MDLSLSEDDREIRDWVRTFVAKEVEPLEPVVLELGRSFVPFSFGGDADNILFEANDEQRATYLLPTIEGTRRSCFAITEPGAGSDAGNIRTSAVRQGAEWVINGEKTFISGGDVADFAVLQIHGGMGYTRELRLLRIYEGTDEIQRRTIARNLLAGHASVRGHLG